MQAAGWTRINDRTSASAIDAKDVKKGSRVDPFLSERLVYLSAHESLTAVP
jgi:hypothetical protein